MNILSCPVAYTGNKSKQIEQIITSAPSVDTFVDVFGGSGVVTINAAHSGKFNTVFYNELDKYVWSLVFNSLTVYNFADICEMIHENYPTDKSGYLLLRDDYNKERTSVKKSAMLFNLICRSFSNMCRHNKSGQFNVPFGERNHLPIRIQASREAYIAAQSSGVVGWLGVDYKRAFSLLSERPSVVYYVDPPYAVSDASYNNGWTENDQVELHAELDAANKRGQFFMYHNVIENRGKMNEGLISWLENNSYNVLDSVGDFRNTSFRKATGKTVEVMITNY